MAKILNIRLTDDMAARLDALSEKTKRPKSYYVKEILDRYLGEYEDAYFALDRLNDRNARYYSTEDLDKALDL